MITLLTVVLWRVGRHRARGAIDGRDDAVSSMQMAHYMDHFILFPSRLDGTADTARRKASPHPSFEKHFPEHKLYPP
jgi:hypothetical protein